MKIKINLRPGARPWWDKHLGRRPEKKPRFLTEEHKKEAKMAFSLPFVAIRGLVTILSGLITGAASKIHPLRAYRLWSLRRERRNRAVRRAKFLRRLAGSVTPTPAPSPAPGRRGVNGAKIMFYGLGAVGVALVAVIIVFGYIGIKGVGTKKPAAPVATTPKPKQAQPQVATAPKGTLRSDTAVQASGVSPTPAPAPQQSTAPRQSVAQAPQPAAPVRSAAQSKAAPDLVTKRGLPIRLVDLASGEPFGVRYGEAVGVIIPFETSACIWVVEHGKKISGGRDKYRRDSLLTTDGMLYYFETPASSEKPVTIVIEKAIKVKKAANAH